MSGEHETCIWVQVLNLDFCTLGNLPASLGDLTALTTLDVEGNLYLGDAFRQLPSTPPGMPPLFPLNLSGLSSLRYLNLNACGLTQIPEVRHPTTTIGNVAKVLAKRMSKPWNSRSASRSPTHMLGSYCLHQRPGIDNFDGAYPLLRC